MQLRPGSSRGRATKIAAICAVLAAALLTPQAASAIEVVNDDGDTTDAGPFGACGAAAHTSLQAAHDAADPGETVAVCEGTYDSGNDATPLVAVAKSVTFLGPQAGVDARERTGQPEALLSDEEGAFNVQANDVTIDGFIVEDTTDMSSQGTGIFLAGANSDQHVVNNIVRDNIFGLYLNSNGQNQTVVHHNLFQNNNESGSAAGNGIYGDQNTDNVLIDANRFVDHINTAVQLTHTTGVNSDVIISDNEMENTNANPALNENRILLLKTDGATVEGNTLIDNANNAIQLLGEAKNIEIVGNEIDNPGFAGIRIRDCDAASCGTAIGPNSNVSVIGNSLLNGDSGINVADHGYAGTLEAHANRIVGNTTGIQFDDAGEDANAQDNWWGCNEGPAGADCDPIAGAGAAAVDFDPWLVLELTADPTVIPTGGSSDLTAALSSVNGIPSEFPDTQLGFGTNLGTVATPQELLGGEANSTLTAGSTAGTATVSATLDNETVTTPVQIQAAAAALPAPGPEDEPDPIPAPGKCSNEIAGTSGDDVLDGTSGSDAIRALRGDDEVRGKAGDDCLLGSLGADVVVGGQGADDLAGGGGRDRVRAADGVAEKVRCGSGRDRAVVDEDDRVSGCERSRVA
jgi:Right handed beta helix region/RTX calcium-binding nonapeptide repeat (4 copies)